MSDSLIHHPTPSLSFSGTREPIRALSPDSTLSFIASLGGPQMAVLARHGLEHQDATGERTLRDACADAAIDPSVVLAELTRSLASEDLQRARWYQRRMRDLTTHIVQEHHTFARAAYRRVHPLLTEVTSRYGKRMPRLSLLVAHFEQLAGGLEARLLHEVRVLFPYVEALERNRIPNRAAGSESPLANLNAHARALQITSEMASLTDGFIPPPRARPMLRTLYAVLGEIRSDLLVHVALEEKILFPRALAKEADLRRRH